jgi:hypothetical protein
MVDFKIKIILIYKISFIYLGLLMKKRDKSINNNK